MAAAFLELLCLAYEIPNYPVDLLNHCLGQDLGLGTNFDRCYRAAPDGIADISYCSGRRNQLSKGSIAASSRNADRSILNVENALAGIDSLMKYC